MNRILSSVGLNCKIFRPISFSGCSIGKGIYLDFQATTPIDPRVLDVMMPFQVEFYGNPHSVTHHFGTDVSDYVEVARQHIAGLIGAASSKEIIFTSGATESNNLAIKGSSEFLLEKGKNHIIVSEIEHKCVLQTAKDLSKHCDIEFSLLPVQGNGIVNLEEFQDLITDKTGLVSVMYVNNEVGVIQPIREIGEICKENDILLHTDAAQALGKIEIDVIEDNIDLMSMSSHKLYGPKGIGGLYVKRKRPRIDIKPIISGGGQERGMRSGTLPSFLCIGFGEACRIAQIERIRDEEHLKNLQTILLDGFMTELEEVHVNGDLESRYYGNLNLSFAYVEGESLMLSLEDEVYLSSGSACTSERLEPSYVLNAMNIDDSLAHTSIRFGLGRFTTEKEIKYSINKIVDGVKKLRDLSPLYYMAKKGIDLNEIVWDDDHHH